MTAEQKRRDKKKKKKEKAKEAELAAEKGSGKTDQPAEAQGCLL